MLNTPEANGHRKCRILCRSLFIALCCETSNSFSYLTLFIWRYDLDLSGKMQLLYGSFLTIKTTRFLPFILILVSIYLLPHFPTLKKNLLIILFMHLTHMYNEEGINRIVMKLNY